MEERSTHYSRLETWSDEDILTTILDDQIASLAAVRDCLPTLAAAAATASRRLADGDGRLSRDEFRRAQREIHDEADFDRSTTLGRSEYNGSPSLTLFRF